MEMIIRLGDLLLILDDVVLDKTRMRFKFPHARLTLLLLVFVLCHLDGAEFFGAHFALISSKTNQ